jgi:hypothetical protein
MGELKQQEQAVSRLRMRQANADLVSALDKLNNEPQTIAQLIAAMEKVCNGAHGGGVWPEIGTRAFAPTGEPYVRLAIGRIFTDELERAPLLATSEAAACIFFFRAFRDYAYGPRNIDNNEPRCMRGTLYWRKKPELRLVYLAEVDKDGQLTERGKQIGARDYYLITARFLISDSPRVL